MCVILVLSPGTKGDEFILYATDGKGLVRRMSRAHGTRSSYTAGCRCDECRTANNTYMHKYYHERLATPSWTPWRNSRAWEPWEDALVKDKTKTAIQIAIMLERTQAAVKNRRRILNARRNKQESRARTNTAGDTAINQKEEQK